MSKTDVKAKNRRTESSSFEDIYKYIIYKCHDADFEEFEDLKQFLEINPKDDVPSIIEIDTDAKYLNRDKANVIFAIFFSRNFDRLFTGLYTQSDDGLFLFKKSKDDKEEFTLKSRDELWKTDNWLLLRKLFQTLGSVIYNFPPRFLYIQVEFVYRVFFNYRYPMVGDILFMNENTDLDINDETETETIKEFIQLAIAKGLNVDMLKDFHSDSENFENLQGEDELELINNLYESLIDFNKDSDDMLALCSDPTRRSTIENKISLGGYTFGLDDPTNTILSHILSLIPDEFGQLSNFEIQPNVFDIGLNFNVDAFNSICENFALNRIDENNEYKENMEKLITFLREKAPIDETSLKGFKIKAEIEVLIGNVGVHIVKNVIENHFQQKKLPNIGKLMKIWYFESFFLKERNTNIKYCKFTDEQFAFIAQIFRPQDYFLKAELESSLKSVTIPESVDVPPSDHVWKCLNEIFKRPEELHPFLMAITLFPKHAISLNQGTNCNVQLFFMAIIYIEEVHYYVIAEEQENINDLHLVFLDIASELEIVKNHYNGLSETVSKCFDILDAIIVNRMEKNGYPTFNIQKFADSGSQTEEITLISTFENISRLFVVHPKKALFKFVLGDEDFEQLNLILNNWIYNIYVVENDLIIRTLQTHLTKIQKADIDTLVRPTVDKDYFNHVWDVEDKKYAEKSYSNYFLKLLVLFVKYAQQRSDKTVDIELKQTTGLGSTPQQASSFKSKPGELGDDSGRSANFKVGVADRDPRKTRRVKIFQDKMAAVLDLKQEKRKMDAEEEEKDSLETPPIPHQQDIEDVPTTIRKNPGRGARNSTSVYFDPNTGRELPADQVAAAKQLVEKAKEAKNKADKDKISYKDAEDELNKARTLADTNPNSKQLASNVKQLAIRANKLAEIFEISSKNAKELADEAAKVSQPTVPTVPQPPAVVSNPTVPQPPAVVSNPPVVNPPVANPPVVNPPVANPPVVNPPVVNPPVVVFTQPVAPPVVVFTQPVAPPVVVSNPPAANPPVVNPPVVVFTQPVAPPVVVSNPPAANPPAANPPVVVPPPAATPPAATPPQAPPGYDSALILAQLGELRERLELCCSHMANEMANLKNQLNSVVPAIENMIGSPFYENSTRRRELFSTIEDLIVELHKKTIEQISKAPPAPGAPAPPVAPTPPGATLSQIETLLQRLFGFEFIRPPTGPEDITFSETIERIVKKTETAILTRINSAPPGPAPPRQRQASPEPEEKEDDPVRAEKLKKENDELKRRIRALNLPTALGNTPSMSSGGGTSSQEVDLAMFNDMNDKIDEIRTTLGTGSSGGGRKADDPKLDSILKKLNDQTADDTKLGKLITKVTTMENSSNLLKTAIDDMIRVQGTDKVKSSDFNQFKNEIRGLLLDKKGDFDQFRTETLKEIEKLKPDPNEKLDSEMIAEITSEMNAYNVTISRIMESPFSDLSREFQMTSTKINNKIDELAKLSSRLPQVFPDDYQPCKFQNPRLNEISCYHNPDLESNILRGLVNRNIVTVKICEEHKAKMDSIDDIEIIAFTFDNVTRLYTYTIQRMSYVVN